MPVRYDTGSSGELRAHWPLILTGSMGMALAAAMVIMQGVMIVPIEHEFGWSRAQISSGSLIVSVLGLVLSTGAGYAIDRMGARRIGIAVAISMSGALLLLATTTNNIWHWWFGWTIYGLAATATGTVWLAPISARFDKARGMAIALTLAGTGISGTLLPIIANFVIEHHGWRAAYFVVGALFAVIMIPLTVFVWHGAEERPEAGIAASTEPAAELPGMTVREGFLSPNFYIIVASMMISSLAWVAMSVNTIPILISLNLTAGKAAAIAGTQGLSGIAGRFLGGWATDRMPAKWVVGGATLCTLALPVTYLAEPGDIPLIFAVVMFGSVMSGVKYSGIVYLVSRHFGPKSFGTLFGTVSTAPAVAAGVGPVLASYVYDVTRSYSLAIWATLPAMALAALLVILLGRYPDFGPVPDE
jgi:MFS family permease